MDTIRILFWGITLALGFWGVKQGCSILERKYSGKILRLWVIKIVKYIPDMIFFFAALKSDHADFAVGSLAGDVMVLCTAGIGTGIIIACSRSHSKTFTIENSVRTQGLVFFFAIPLVICILIDGLCLSFGFIGVLGFLGLLFVMTTFQKSHSHKYSPKEKDESDDHQEESVVDGFAFTFIGCLIVWIFSDNFIDTLLASRNHISKDIILGFFFSPLISEFAGLIEIFLFSNFGSQNSLDSFISRIIESSMLKSSILLSILCIFGYQSHFTWKHSEYSLIFLLLAFTLLTVGYIVWKITSLTKFHGFWLFALFLIASFLLINEDNSNTSSTHFILNSAELTLLSSGKTALATNSFVPRDILAEIKLNPFG
eukprot:c24271_g1_i1.p1 GENE.c24271_g1_i1~~c24271_g1_i1.p1  ORF type:complete len:370 (-),score=108.49 c24271_g1_i1:48-1157(-)